MDLVAWLPPRWQWDTVRVLCIGVRDETSSVPLLVWVEADWFVVELEPGEKPERLARIECPREAVAALERLFVASAVVAQFADLSVLGGAS